MTGLSVFVIAKNAQSDLDECLRLAAPVADDIVVVVDAVSADNTMDAARAHTQRVWLKPFEGFSAMKQFALSQCSAEWALNIDTDERLTPELIREIQRIKTAGDAAIHGYEINRLPYFLGKPIRHGGWYPDWVLRLVRREKAFYPARAVHERLVVDGPTARIGGEMLHYTARRWDEFLAKQRRFAKLAEVEPSAWRSLTRAPAAFLKSAALQLGVLDGWRGLAVAWARGYYTYHKYRK